MLRLWISKVYHRNLCYWSIIFKFGHLEVIFRNFLGSLFRFISEVPLFHNEVFVFNVFILFHLVIIKYVHFFRFINILDRLRNIILNDRFSSGFRDRFRLNSMRNLIFFYISNNIRHRTILRPFHRRVFAECIYHQIQSVVSLLHALLVSDSYLILYIYRIILFWCWILYATTLMLYLKRV